MVLLPAKIPHSSISSNKHDNPLVVVCALQQVQWDGVERRVCATRRVSLVLMTPVNRCPTTFLSTIEFRGLQPTSCQRQPSWLVTVSFHARSLPLEARCFAEGDKSLRYRSRTETQGEAAHGTARSHVNCSTDAQGIGATNNVAVQWYIPNSSISCLCSSCACGLQHNNMTYHSCFHNVVQKN